MRENNDREVCDPFRPERQTLQGLSNEPCCERPDEPMVSDREVCCEEPCYPIREINITPLNYGFIVKVGCQTFAIETTETLLDKLNGYLKDPTNVERKWQRDHKL